jgi:hypothetical protein
MSHSDSRIYRPRNDDNRLTNASTSCRDQEEPDVKDLPSDMTADTE